MMPKPDRDKLVRIAELLYSRLGSIDELIEITDESMNPTFKTGSLAAISAMPFPKLINWSEYYFIIDVNGQGRVRRVYEGEIENRITLVTDHPDQSKYPPMSISWDEITAIYKVKAEIIKH